jgi:hypothetical protein
MRGSMGQERERGRGRGRGKRTMGGKVGDAADGIALDLDVRGGHLLDERLKTAKTNDQNLVLGIDSEIAEGGRGGTLDLDVGRLEEEHDGLESVPVDLLDGFLRDLGKGEGGGALEVDIVGEGEGGEGAEGFALEEVGFSTV